MTEDSNETAPDSGAPKSGAKKSGAKKKKRKAKKKGRAFWLNLAQRAAAVLVWAIIAVGVVLGFFALGLPTIDQAALTRTPNIVILDQSGGVLMNAGDKYGASVELDQVPKHLIQAVVAVEDRRFFEHGGIDLRGLGRAMTANVTAGRLVQGGSTITQQVAKNLFLTPERTIARKIREAMLAVWLEQKFTKQEILQVYLNRVYLGAGTYGVAAASEHYFGRPVTDLTLYQSAVLAGLLKAPSRYSPANDTELAGDRASVVLATMVDVGFITPEQATAAERTAQRVLRTAGAPRPTARARYFTDWIVAQLESFIGPVDRDIVVRTTLDGAIQANAEAVLDRQLDAVGKAQKIGQGAVVVLGTDGAVMAMVGGRDYVDSQFNRVTQAQRQPGSAFKPFVYLAAVHAGLRPDDMITDGPISLGKWRPQNFSGTYRGPVTVSEAVADSINTVAVRVAQQTGLRAVQNAAHRMGITAPLPDDFSIALGSAEVTLLELTSAYAPFANGGEAVLPYAITDITGQRGEVLYRRGGTGMGRVLDDHELATMNQLLHGVIEGGTGKDAAFGYPAAGKTGTSSDFRDAWFIGYSAEYVTGVWVGNDNGDDMKGVTGGGVPARIWREVMTAAHAGHERRDLPGLEQHRGGMISRLFRSIFGD